MAFTFAPVAQRVKNLPAMWKTLDQEGSLVKGMTTPTLVFLPGEYHGQRSLVGYSPWGHRIRHDWVTNTFTLFLDIKLNVFSKKFFYRWEMAYPNVLREDMRQVDFRHIKKGHLPWLTRSYGRNTRAERLVLGEVRNPAVASEQGVSHQTCFNLLNPF